jgi:hypothetical protein
MTLLATDRVALVAAIDPDAYTAAAYTTDWVDMTKFKTLMAVVYVGTMATNSTVDAKLQAADDGAGSNPIDLTGKAITQLTEAGTDSDKQAIINLREDEINAQATTAGKQFVALVVTVTTAASDMGAAIYGLDPVYNVASDADLASVDEIVT